MAEEKIFVTKTFLPPIEEYEAFLKQIWERDFLTNQGPLLHEFEDKVQKYLGVDTFQFVANGTLALQIALRALDITDGEVITTPFTYVATTESILWERCTPVFVDIDPDTFTIDADKIEAAITDKTRAIMPVHVFGIPCDIEKIDAIAKKHDLKVIYDAAHAFGAQYKGKSLMGYGDISIGSFHATKLFHTIEGGCLVVRDQAVSDKVELLKRFGHNNDDHILAGTNAKASEFQAAMGLANLKYVNGNIKKRKKICEQYDSLLPDDRFRKQAVPTDTVRNYSYYPVVVDSEKTLLDMIKRLNKENIFPRRYFYPSLNKLPYITTAQSAPVSEDIASRIMCLPLHADLDAATVTRICKILNK